MVENNPFLIDITSTSEVPNSLARQRERSERPVESVLGSTYECITEKSLAIL